MRKKEIEPTFMLFNTFNVYNLRVLEHFATGYSSEIFCEYAVCLTLDIVQNAL